MRTLAIIAALALSACATGPSEKDWTSNGSSQSFRTAVAACNQISYNVEANFVTCMAGRGWVKAKR
jgi:starvation-inducible outer membrane lipoprotein